MSNFDKVMEAMVASAGQESQTGGSTPRIEGYDSTAMGSSAGSEILAILQRKISKLNPEVPIFVPKPALGGPIRDQNGNFLIYDREFLLDCAKSVAVEEMPKGLEEKLAEFPRIRRASQTLMDLSEIGMLGIDNGQQWTTHHGHARTKASF